jgi:hypothetical protein
MLLEVLAQDLANATPWCSVPSDQVWIKPLDVGCPHLVSRVSPSRLYRFEEQFGGLFC